MFLSCTVYSYKTPPGIDKHHFNTYIHIKLFNLFTTLKSVNFSWKLNLNNWLPYDSPPEIIFLPFLKNKFHFKLACLTGHIIEYVERMHLMAWNSTGKLTKDKNGKMEGECNVGAKESWRPKKFKSSVGYKIVCFVF